MSQNILIDCPKISHHYSILIGKLLFDYCTWLPKKKFSQIAIITDDTIKKLYGLQLQTHLIENGYITLLFSFPAGEKSKNYKTKQIIERNMNRRYCDRNTLIIALGGGVVGDLSGFIAATFLRGIDYIQIPTSLLAMVDSSIGGKTGINTSDGKNLIGSIYQPIGVVIDVTFLKILSKTHLINGLIECIKMFLTHDGESFQYVSLHLNDLMQGNENILNDLIIRAARIKSSIVVKDEKDLAERNTLNFGHTIGHAIEKISHYTLLHGFAVAYGILVEATISHLIGLLNNEQWTTIKYLIASLGIHGHYLKKYNFNQLIHATKIDKKTQSGKVNYVLLKSIGSVYALEDQFTHMVPDEIVKQALEKITRSV